ncbi:MAG: Ig domain-containing protein, partial [Myxococcota bacterium]
TRLLTNEGVAPSGEFSYSYYLSTNPTISPLDDILLFTGTSSLDIGQEDFGIDTFPLPADLEGGDFYIGAVVDGEAAIDEVSETNNVFTGPQISVFATTIQFFTRDLPDGVTGAPYEVGVYTTGAPSAVTYAIADGELPSGLTLNPTTGILSGTPTAEGTFEFTVRASAGSAFAERTFVVRITAPSVDLRIATMSVPSAFVGREYTAQIVAVGGQQPYVWTALSPLPAGLTLSESGVVSGVPETPGIFPINFLVVGNSGAQSTREISINVISGAQSIQIQQNLLFAGEVNVSYCEPALVSFEAINGVPPYTWTIVGDVPPGMSLSGGGEFCGTPTEAGQFPFTVRVQDAGGTFDTGLFVFVVDNGPELAISTSRLPAGDINQPYVDASNSDEPAVALVAIRGTEPYAWSVVEGAGALPAGMSLSTDGMLTGTPTEAGLFAFLVQVVDAQKRTDTQPLSVFINDVPMTAQPTEEGCTCSTPADSRSTPWTALALLGAFTVLLGRRGRRRVSSLWGVLVALVVLTDASAVQAQFTSIPGTPYFVRRANSTFTPLTDCTVLSTEALDDTFNVNLPFPFRFYDRNEDRVRITNNGSLGFGSNSPSANSNPPLNSSAAPNAWIAGFSDWVDILPTRMSRLCHTTVGTAPDRRFIVEWRNLWFRLSTAGNFSMRMVFHEGPGSRIDIEYSPVSGTQAWSATMGMEDQNGARPIYFAPSRCMSNCSQSDLLAVAGTTLTFQQDVGVELIARAIDTPLVAFSGAISEINVRVDSIHGNRIGPFSVAVQAAT